MLYNQVLMIMLKEVIGIPYLMVCDWCFGSRRYGQAGVMRQRTPNYQSCCTRQGSHS